MSGCTLRAPFTVEAMLRRWEVAIGEAIAGRPTS
jgi:hypothetical protein